MVYDGVIMMKKRVIFAMLLCCCLLLGSCTSNSFRTKFFMRDDRAIINSYFDAFIAGVNNRDAQAIHALFVSLPSDSSSSLSEQIEAAFSYLPTPLTNTTSGTGCSSSSHFSPKIQRTEIEEIYTVECNDQRFFAAMKICSEDSSNSEEVGIISIYFINSQDYHEDVRYRGDGKWTPGINLQ